MPDTCADLLGKAYHYLATRTAAWPTDYLRAVIQAPEQQRLVRAIDAAVLANDYKATANACRQYWQAVLAQPPATDILT